MIPRDPLRYAANVSMIFRHLPFRDRFHAAIEAGFKTIEMYWPTEEELPRSGRAAFASELETLGIQVVQLNFTVGDRLGVDCGVAGEPDRVDHFRRNIPEALELASLLGCKRLNALAGRSLEGFEDAYQADILAESISLAADSASDQGASIMIEALNRVDFPGYLLPSNAAAIAFIENLNRSNVKLLFDLYHSVMNEEDPIAVIALAAPHLGNVHLADMPGRHEPGSGTLPFKQIVAQLEGAGYIGWVGCEYIPENPDWSVAALARVREYLAALPSASPLAN